MHLAPDYLCLDGAGDVIETDLLAEQPYFIAAMSLVQCSSDGDIVRPYPLLTMIVFVGCAASGPQEWNSFSGQDHQAGSAALASARTFLAQQRCFDMPERQVCRVLEVEEVDHDFITIAVREWHTPKCGGDPVAAPVLGRLQLSRSGATIRCWHGGLDIYTPCDSRCESDAEDLSDESDVEGTAGPLRLL